MPPVQTPALTQIHFHPETDGAFQISPFTGVLAPYKNEEFLLTFRPKEVRGGLTGFREVREMRFDRSKPVRKNMRLQKNILTRSHC